MNPNPATKDPPQHVAPPLYRPHDNNIVMRVFEIRPQNTIYA